MRRVRTSWVSFFIMLVGIYNMLSGMIFVPFASFFASYIEFVTSQMVVFSGFSQMITGFILTLGGFGLYRRYRVALFITVIFICISLFTSVIGANIPGIFITGIILWFLYSRRGEFIRSLGISLEARHIAAVWIIVFVFIYGTLGALYFGNQYRPEITTPIQALYFTIITATTVGYGDNVPVTDEARLFTISLIFVGVGAFLSAFTLIFQPLVSRLEEKAEKKKGMTQ